MKKCFFTLFLNLLLISTGSANCYMHFFKKVIYAGNKKDLNKAQTIKKTNCSLELAEKFHQIVTEGQGTLRSHYLSEIDENIEFSPAHFELISLEEFINNKMNLPESLELTQTKFMSKLKALSLSGEDNLLIQAEFKTGKSVIPLKLLRKNGSSEALYIQAFGTKEIEVFVATTDISPGVEELSEGHFKKVKKKITDPDLYFKDQKKIAFYKLNRNLRKNEALKKSSLVKKNLVTYGSPARITFKRGSLILKGMGIPTQSGRLGDLVKLKQPNNKKIIFGKVDGINSVLVGL